jgi:hypothetical protein
MGIGHLPAAGDGEACQLRGALEEGAQLVGLEVRHVEEPQALELRCLCVGDPGEALDVHGGAQAHSGAIVLQLGRQVVVRLAVAREEGALVLGEGAADHVFDFFIIGLDLRSCRQRVGESLGGLLDLASEIQSPSFVTVELIREWESG